MYVLCIPAKLVNMCRLTLADTKSLVKVDGEKLEPFITTKGFKQMVCHVTQLTCSLTLGSTKFEVVKEFIYMGTQITTDNNISAEIR